MSYRTFSNIFSGIFLIIGLYGLLDYCALDKPESLFYGTMCVAVSVIIYIPKNESSS